MGLINAQEGDRIVFAHPHAGWAGDVQAGFDYLGYGQTYTIEEVVRDRVSSLIARQLITLVDIENAVFDADQFEPARDT